MVIFKYGLYLDRHMKKILSLLILFTLFGCVAPSEDVIKVGALLSLTGPAAQYGQASVDGLEMAVQEINEKGGIKGKKVELVYEDDGTDSKKAVTAFNKLVHVDQVDAIIGGQWDFNYNAIAPLAEQNEILLITPQNVMTPGLILNDYTFTMRPEMVRIVWTLEEYFKENDIKKVAIVRFVSNYGAAISQGLQDIMERTDGEFVLDETYEQIGGNDFLTSVLKVKESGADAVFLDMIGGDLANFVKRSRESNLDIQLLSHGIVVDALANPDIPDDILEGLVYFDYDTPPAEEFIEKYREIYGKAPSHSADGAYDSMIILADALENVDDISELSQYLEETTFITINGEFSFKDHIMDTREIFIQQIEDGEIVTLSTKIVKQE